MTKANGPRTRPKVAKKTANQTADIYDFVQSPEWQKVLEKARVEREKNLSAPAQQNKEGQQPKPVRRRTNQSTTNERAQSMQKPWSAQVEEARHKRNEVLARRAAESKKADPSSPEARQGDLQGGDKATSTRTPRQKDKPTNREQTDRAAAKPDQATAKSVLEEKDAGRPGPSDDALVSEDASLSALTRAELSLILSSEEVDHRLSKKLLQQLKDHQRTRRRIRWSLVALGCTIGVVASSSIFLTLFGLGVSNPIESAAIGSTDGTAADDFGQTGPSQPDVPSGAGGEAVISADLFDASSLPSSSGAELEETQDLSSLASSAPLQSELAETAEIVEPGTPSLAPSVLSYVPTLEPPLLPVGGAGYLPRREANPSFLPYEFEPEFFTTSIALLDEVSAGFDPVAISIDPIPPSRRTTTVSSSTEVVEPSTSSVPPSVLSFVAALEPPLLPVGRAGDLPKQEANPSFLPYELEPELFATRIALVDEFSTEIDPLTISIEQIIPPQRAPSVSSQLVSLQSPVALEAAEDHQLPSIRIQEPQPDRPLAGNPAERLLKVVSSDPSILLEDVALSPPIPQALTLKQMPNPLDSATPAALPAEDIAALPGEDAKPSNPSASGGGASFRLYAPNKIPNDAVDSFVAELTTTGHELSGTARVGYKVSQSNVRFYHSQDAAKAAALAKDAGALLRDFTGSKSKTPTGVIELYLAGEGLGQAPVKRVAKKSRRSTTQSSPVNRLKSQVLKKLRTTTN